MKRINGYLMNMACQEIAVEKRRNRTASLRSLLSSTEWRSKIANVTSAWVVHCVVFVAVIKSHHYHLRDIDFPAAANQTSNIDVKLWEQNLQGRQMNAKLTRGSSLIGAVKQAAWRLLMSCAFWKLLSNKFSLLPKVALLSELVPSPHCPCGKSHRGGEQAPQGARQQCNTLQI